MDYEKAYKEALETAREIYNDSFFNEGVSGHNLMERLFPELKESEDELTWLTKYIEEEAYSLSMDIRGDEDRIKLKNLQKSLAWLEKQGENVNFQDKIQVDNQVTRNYNNVLVNSYQSKKIEQKTADNVEQKFKVGYWITTNACTRYRAKIKAFIENGMVEFEDGTFETEENLVKNYHLWTIQDAKNGDVLSNGDMILIFKEFEMPAYKQHIIAYIGLDNCGHIQVTNEHWMLGIDKVKPATKEQRDTLFAKMKEAGYEWDAENKVLSKIEKQGEQKPNPYTGTTFEYNGHTWGMCARDNGVDILLDKRLFKHLEKQGELENNNITRDDEILQAISAGLIDVAEDAGWSDFGGIPIEEILDWLDKQGKQNPKDKYTFKSIPRLLEMIKPTDRAKAYCQKLIDSLLQEGYTTDAKIVGDCLKQMNGEKVAMATMDEQKPTLRERYENISKSEWFNRTHEGMSVSDEQSKWSEEDEVKINRIVACLENLNVADNDILLKDIDWLKSLKQRIGG